MSMNYFALYTRSADAAFRIRERNGSLLSREGAPGETPPGDHLLKSREEFNWIKSNLLEHGDTINEISHQEYVQISMARTGYCFEPGDDMVI
jgi:hypothetical protein